MRDEKISGTRLATLHPKVRETFRSFIDECERGDPQLTLRITQAFRTTAEQNAIYALGRTVKGQIRTKVQGGYSYHNYGLAIDLVELDGANNEIADWNYDMGKLAPIAKKYGIGWGGNFKSLVDKPHFEITFGLRTRDLLALVNIGKVDKDGYVLLPDLDKEED